MARSDLLLNLVRAEARGDHGLFVRAVEAMIAEERAKRHHVLADRLAENLKVNGSAGHASPAPLTVDARAQALFHELTPRRRFEDLILADDLVAACAEVVEEQQRNELLHAHGLEPRNRILLIGPPGNGKTSVAEAIAERLMFPLISVRYEAIIGSFLGETASRLQRLFDHVRTRRCVLFFDEFDTLGKERGDEHETGEIKRVVSSLLLQVDALPSYVVVVAASNHPELFDRAVWRRFQLRLTLPAPKRPQIDEWVRRFEKRVGTELGQARGALASRLAGLNFAEIEEFGTDVIRRRLLAEPDAPVDALVSSRLKQLKLRAHPARPRRA
jgi:AAA+ superfamily predicted ATPase